MNMQSLGREEGWIQEDYTSGEDEDKNKSPRSSTAEKELWRKKIIR